MQPIILTIVFTIKQNSLKFKILLKFSKTSQAFVNFQAETMLSALNSKFMQIFTVSSHRRIFYPST